MSKKGMKYKVIMNNLKTRKQLERACRDLNESDKGSREDLIERINSHSYKEIKVVIG